MAAKSMDIPTLVRHSIAALSKGTIPSSAILNALLSKLLGYLVIAGAVFAKLPQVLNVVKAKSAEGLSPLTFELETYGFLVTSAYGYLTGLAFTTYGESIFLLAQNLVLLTLIYRFQKHPVLRPMVTSSLLAGGISLLVSGVVTTEAITAAYGANNLVMISSRVPQILKNFSAKSTGQLSSISLSMFLLGCFVRIYTSIQAGTPAMVISYVIAAVLNGTLLAQIIFYSKPAAKGKDARKKKD